MSGIAIVGAGEAGVSAAFALRENGFSGTIDLYSAEPHLPYERPPLSKNSGDDDRELHRPIRDREMFAANDISLHLRKPVLDISRDERQVRFCDGSTAPYSKLLMALGCEPRRLSVPGAELCRYLRTLDDARAIHDDTRAGRSVVIIGAGLIGLELAACSRSKGCTVTVLEGQDRILSRIVPPELARIVHERHVSSGVGIVCGAAVVQIVDIGSRKCVQLADGREYVADLVVAGVGAVPTTDLAERCGLAVDNGVVVNEMLQTADENIFAAGDCCSFPSQLYGSRLRLESWRASQEQGAAAARNMLGACEPFVTVPWFWSDQFDMTLQIAGLPGAGQLVIERPGVAGYFSFHLDGGGHLVAACAAANGNHLARDIRLCERLIAAQVVLDPTALGAGDLKLKDYVKRLC